MEMVAEEILFWAKTNQPIMYSTNLWLSRKIQTNVPPKQETENGAENQIVEPTAILL